jgi:hypothetical protein
MRKLFYIIFFFQTSTYCLTQISLNKEANWSLANKNQLESYKYDFLFYDDSTFNNVRKNLNIELTPHLESGLQANKGVIKSGLNLNFYSTYKYLIDFYVAYNGGYINTANTIYESGLQAKSFFQFKHSASHYSYHDLRTRIIYKTNKYIQFHAGIDKHMIGEGDRSILIGDQGIANPFALLKINFWKFEYLNMQQIWREGRTFHYSPKGNATHFINFKPSKKFSFGIFETVTHLIKDTLYNRGFEVEYLNPLIFYRPQEYSVGSTDNVMLGLNSHLTFRNTMFYGQFILDEFLLSSIRSRTRSWLNKFGVQLGVKSKTTIKETPVFVRSELNMVRPYTYSHAGANLSFTNQQQTMAHPLGANFIEWYNEAKFSHKKINYAIWVQYYLKGVDSLGTTTSFGGDLYKPYTAKPINQNENFYIGSGVKINGFQFGLNASTIVSKYKWEFFVEPRLLIQIQNGIYQTNFYGLIGIRSRLFSDKRNY